MKNILSISAVVFLVLPAICFGRVLKVSYNTIGSPKEGFETVIIFKSDKKLPYYSKTPNGELNPKIFQIDFDCVKDYKPHMNCVRVADNQRECYSLKLTLQKIFNVNSLEIWPNNDVVLHPITLSAKLEELFVLHGFQVTYKKEVRNEETQEYDYEWFLYKNDSPLRQN